MMKTHEQRDKLRFICHQCSYDMTGRADADPCPECSTPFDTRKDLPGAEGRSKRAVVYVVIAILCNPLAVPIGILIALYSHPYDLLAQAEKDRFQDSIPYHQTTQTH